MAHHLLPSIGRDWLAGLTHVLLIREPRAMLTSLARVTPSPTMADTGLPQQLELFDRLGGPPVIDARDVLERPAAMLAAMCAAVGVAYTDAMLTWPAGPRATDGVWAQHWYGAVEASTGFQPYAPKTDPVPPALTDVLAGCEPLYDRLHAQRLTA
jgi:hypothetical protein